MQSEDLPVASRNTLWR